MGRKLPSWLTGTRTDILPDPSTHFDLSAMELCDLISKGGLLRLVAFSSVDADVHPLHGRWPLVIDVGRDGPNGVRIVAEDVPDMAYYLNLTDMITVAPAHGEGFV